MTCNCSTTRRCTAAHAIRDAYQATASVPERVGHTRRYTHHLYDAGLLAYPTTAAPTWTCSVACAPDAPCRVETSQRARQCEETGSQAVPCADLAGKEED